MGLGDKRLLPCLSLGLALTLSPTIEILAAETVAVAPDDLAGLKTLEEVVVTGKLDSLSEAKKAVVAAEDRFYARYNELNKDDAFDVHCRMETPTGSHLSYRACVPRFVDDATQADAANLLMSTGGSVMVSSAASIRASLMPELRKRTLALVRKDPELLRALLERARLEQYYTDLRKEKFKGGKWIVWD